MKFSLALIFFLVCCLTTTVLGYNEANCDSRTRTHYESSICQLPYGTDYDNNETITYWLNKCDKSNSTKSNSKDIIYGVLVSLLAAVSFGSMFVPIKKFNTGDGMYFQWMMAIGAWIVGLVINLCLQHQPPFFYFSLLPGFLWATSNIFTVPSFSLIGIGIGQTMQGNVNMLGGWVSGRFILCSHIGNHIFNTIGVVLVIIGSILLSFVKSDGKKKSGKKITDLCFGKKKSSEREPLIASEKLSSSAADINGDIDKSGESIINSTKHQKHDNGNDDDDDSSYLLFKKLQSKLIGKVIGITLAAISGLFCAFQFLPIEFLRRCEHDVFSCQELDYAFGLFSGILVTSTAWFLIYCVCMKFRPKINSRLTVPAIFSGIMFGIGNASWLLSNGFVSLAISFPIITAGASTISCIWGIFVFREITGWKNLGFFLFSFLFVAAGIITVGISFH